MRYPVSSGLPAHVYRNLAAVLLMVNMAASGGGSVLASNAPLSPRECGWAAYRDHLAKMRDLVAGCRAHPDRQHCNSAAVGPDDLVSAPGLAHARLVDYGWLRNTLERAAGNYGKTGDSKRKRQDDLDTAEERLTEALRDGTEAKPPVAPEHKRAQALASAILASRELQFGAHKSWASRMLDRIAIYLNERFPGLIGAGRHLKWLAQGLVWCPLLLGMGAVVTWVYRQSRRARVLSSLAMQDGPAEAAVMRGWRLWREQAETAARQGHWREAIYHLYWAAVAWLEGKRGWSFERARTPREMLEAFGPRVSQRVDLEGLTSLFERVWYGGEQAAEEDYQRAQLLFEAVAGRSFGSRQRAVAVKDGDR
jgi:hypothetical protein